MTINKNNNNNSNNKYISKYKVYNIFTIQNASNVLVGEINNSESLVDRTIHVPTLQEYIKEYVVTGHCSAPYNNKEQFDGDDAPDVDFSPQDFRDADLDDVKDYLNSLNNRIKELEKDEKTKKKVVSSKSLENSKEEESASDGKDREQKQ